MGTLGSLQRLARHFLLLVVTVTLLAPLVQAVAPQATWYFGPGGQSSESPGGYREYSTATYAMQTSGEDGVFEQDSAPLAAPLVVARDQGFHVQLASHTALKDGPISTQIRIRVVDRNGHTIGSIANASFTSTPDANGSRDPATWIDFELDAVPVVGLPSTSATVTIPAGDGWVLEVITSVPASLPAPSGGGVSDAWSTLIVAPANNVIDNTYVGDISPAHPVPDSLNATVCQPPNSGVGCNAWRASATFVNAEMDGDRRPVNNSGFTIGRTLDNVAGLAGIPVAYFRLATPSAPSRLDVRLA